LKNARTLKHLGIVFLALAGKRWTSYVLMSIALVGPSAYAATLCAPDEVVVWSCEAKQKLYSVCASEDLTRTTGYMQYRAGQQGNLELEFPQVKQPAEGLFHLTLLPRGAVIEFSNGHVNYDLREHLVGRTSIVVARKDEVLGTIECEVPSDTLTLTPTLNLLENAGLHD